MNLQRLLKVSIEFDEDRFGVIWFDAECNAVARSSV